MEPWREEAAVGAGKGNPGEKKQLWERKKRTLERTSCFGSMVRNPGENKQP
jgi:hypothetical protein